MAKDVQWWLIEKREGFTSISFESKKNTLGSELVASNWRVGGSSNSKSSSILKQEIKFNYLYNSNTFDILSKVRMTDK